MAVRVGINGLGRIGRLVLRSICDQGLMGKDIEIAAVADVSTDAAYLAYQLRHDSVHGGFAGQVSSARRSSGGAHDVLLIDGRPVKVIPAAEQPALLPWKELGVEVVIEATGLFTGGKEASGHLRAGARKVIITAPSKDGAKTIVMGVNEHEYDDAEHHVISNASCTTHCLALPLHVLVRGGVGIETGLVTAINSVTASQRVVDGFSRRDWRSGRAAGSNIIPSPTNATKLAGEIFPALRERLSGISFRVPTTDVSVVNLVFRAARDSSIEEIDGLMREAAGTYLRGYLGYSEEELVSTDFIHDSRSSIYDSPATLLSNVKGEKRQFRLVAWYDNEWGYAGRVVDLLRHITKKNNS